MASARLPQGHRVNAVLPPLSLNGPLLTIRAFTRRVMTLAELKARGSFDETVEQFLIWAVGSRRSIAVSGGTGSGKTTALWRILQAINERRPCHIVTLEDPIEYVEAGKAALITQRELGTHFATFAEGIRQALRQDPDVILIGEMRDRPAMDAALTAAETGTSSCRHCTRRRQHRL